MGYSDSLRGKGVCLVMGGGGTKGAAIAGVLSILEEHKIPIDLIVGTSAGSLIGAMYSYYRNAQIVADKVNGANFGDFFDISWTNLGKILFTNQGLCKGRNIERFMIHQLPNCDISELKIPLVVTATDLNTFSKVEISQGNLIKAVLASCALPPYFSPVEIDGRILIDGGISTAIPVDIARSYDPKLVVAIDITTHISDFNHRNMMQISYRSLDIVHYHYSKLQATLADMIINPIIEKDGTVKVDFTELYKAGQLAGNEAIPRLKELLKEKNINY